MTEQPLIVLSVLVGGVMAGFVWLLWSLIENVTHAIKHRGQSKSGSNEDIASGGGI